MNANELRVGNWVEANSPMMQVKEITEHTVGLYMPGSEADPFLYDIEEIRPIKLSPEILEKCEGFIKQVGTPNNSKAIYFDFVGYRIYCTDAFCSIHFDAGDWFPEIRKINNLHTFQNWYYFNTGHELTYKQ